MLSNMGASFNTSFLSHIKQEKDHGIDSFMVLLKEEHHKLEEMERYFLSRDYVLNNLGEGLYGWMKRVEKSNGYVKIPGSMNKSYFLTVFIESDINRDPTKRKANELPDSSIVPDIALSVNSSFKLFVNGICYGDMEIDSEGCMNVKIDDVVLDKGINRLAMLIYGGEKDIELNLRFINKYGDNLDSLRYHMTLD